MANIYKLLNLDTSELVDKKHYTNGKKAAKIASRLSKHTGRKYQVRKIDPDAPKVDWRAREAARFDSGDYLPLVTYFHDMLIPDHYAHVSKKAPDLIAYTKDEEKGQADLQSRISVAAYIDLLLDHPANIEKMQGWARECDEPYEQYRRDNFNDVWKQMVVREQQRYGVALTTPVRFVGPVKDPGDGEEVKQIADKIASIYTKYDRNIRALDASCMRMEASYFACRYNGERIHPTSAYASPDLAIAYMQDASGKTIARALCWPDRKIFSRVYADNNVLCDALRALGYTKSGYYGAPSADKSFKGARLRRMEADNEDAFILPYIDGVHNVDDDGAWLRMDGTRIRADRTDGLALNRSATCANCSDDCNENDMTTVYTSNSRTDYQMWCQSCVDNHAFYCNGYDVWYDSANVDQTEVDGLTYSQRYAENHASYCDRSEGYTFNGCSTVVVDDRGNMETWSDDYLDETYEFRGGCYSTEGVPSIDMIDERYVDNTPVKWSRGSGYTRTGVVYYTDNVVQVPECLIENGRVPAYLGEDGNYYLRDYVDHYPMDRPRVPEQGGSSRSWAHTYIETPVFYDLSAGQREMLALERVLQAEQAMSLSAADKLLIDMLELDAITLSDGTVVGV